MKLSIVIVNYNVRHFLQQCLVSVYAALDGLDAEVFVVDNDSVDGSADMVRERFPSVRLIANRENLGFSKANNQAIRESTGEYVLLLNPDTLVEDDTFRKVIGFMDAHPEAGGLGVKMVDGKGRFLPESKRGLPTPAAAFWKISGLARLFPGSRIFGRYHLGFLDKDQVHDVDILSGAFMLMRREALDKCGLLDETFFMYGEDIDLSYRIQQAGYRNYYFPGTRIIHYKGESTKKGSLNYVRMFYQAMVIFARKHFSGQRARGFSLLIHLAIYVRALLAMMSRLARSAALPLLDAGVIFAGIWFIKLFWARYVRFGDAGYYPPEFLLFEVPAFIVIWLVALYFSGAYDRPLRMFRAVRGVVAGSLVILVVYALLPESLRYSRALIILGSFWALIALPLLRQTLHWTGISAFRLESRRNRRFAIVGQPDEVERVSNLLLQTMGKPGAIIHVSPDEEMPLHDYSGSLRQIDEIISIYSINEVVFCARDLAPARIIDAMSGIGDASVDFKIAPPESISIIGSNSIHTAGDVYTIDVDSVSSRSNRRNKRVIDVVAALALLLSSPLLIFLNRHPLGFLRNTMLVLLGRRTWVGYCLPGASSLPRLRPGVLNPADNLPGAELSQDTRHRLDLLYARDYRPTADLAILWRNLRNLGGSRP